MPDLAPLLPQPVSSYAKRPAGRTPLPSDHAMRSFRLIPYATWFPFVGYRYGACGPRAYGMGQEVFGAR